MRLGLTIKAGLRRPQTERRTCTLEKSDCAVVPVNQPNKGGQPSAEAGEGRAQTRENSLNRTCTRHRAGSACPRGWTVCGRQQRKESRSGSPLCSHHLNVELLRDSFYALQRKASPGVDGVTWQEYESGLEDRLVDLRSRMHRGAYRAKPSRRVFIPKADGRQRPLGIAALEDKIMHCRRMVLPTGPKKLRELGKESGSIRGCDERA